MKQVCVFCGSRSGLQPVHRAAAVALGQALARRGLGLVYGGAGSGLMGAMADAALQGGARVTGVMPAGLVDRECAHRGLSELIITPDMHTRKARMGELADAFLALPGGLGTLDELFEILTWAQLGLHQKPVGLLNSGGYWDRLRAFLDQGRAEGFIADASLQLLHCDADPEGILDRLSAASGA